MQSRFKLTEKDLQPSNEQALDSFYSGIKSLETKRSMDKNLKTFLVDICEDILHGDYKQRAGEFVLVAKKDQEKAIQIIFAYVNHLKKRTLIGKAEPNYLNPSTVPNKIKPIKKLLDMNGVGLAWKRIYSTYPEHNNIYKGRAYTKKEIKRMLEFSDGISTDFIILAASSGGFRLGAWDSLRWGDLFTVIKSSERYKVIETPDDNSDVVCAGLTIYSGTSEEYKTLISIEAWRKLQEYKKEWIVKVKRRPEKNDPLIIERFSKPKALTSLAVKNRIQKILIRSGIRIPLTEGNRRYDVPLTHGFRRYWDKVMMETSSNSDKLASLVKKERLLGHGGIVKTDKNYYWTEIVDLVPEYLKAMPELMINDDSQLKERLEENEKTLGKKKDIEKEKNQLRNMLDELEAKIQRMQKYDKKN